MPKFFYKLHYKFQQCPHISENTKWWWTNRLFYNKITSVMKIPLASPYWPMGFTQSLFQPITHQDLRHPFLMDSHSNYMSTNNHRKNKLLRHMKLIKYGTYSSFKAYTKLLINNLSRLLTLKTFLPIPMLWNHLMKITFQQSTFWSKYKGP